MTIKNTFLKIIILSAVFIYCNNCDAQILGCTDWQAINFNANATINDGSCTYPATNLVAQSIKTLDSSLVENSALVQITPNFYTINDGGFASEIITIDTSLGTTKHRTKIIGAINVDWEALCIANNKVFIGDFGNNGGNRTNLKIYTCSVDSLAEDSCTSTIIPFKYENQTNFTYNTKTDFDAEAMIALRDTLFIFTKRWTNKKTTLYYLPSNGSSDTARIVDSFNVNCYISDATVDKFGRIILIGYDSTGNAFLWLLSDYKFPNLFSGNKRKINLGTSVGQAEGICTGSDGLVYISSEKLLIFPPQLFKIDIRKYWPAPLHIVTPAKEKDLYLANGQLTGNMVTHIATIKVYDLNGQLLYSGNAQQAPKLNEHHGVILCYFTNNELIRLKY